MASYAEKLLQHEKNQYKDNIDRVAVDDELSPTANQVRDVSGSADRAVWYCAFSCFGRRLWMIS